MKLFEKKEKQISKMYGSIGISDLEEKSIPQYLKRSRFSRYICCKGGFCFRAVTLSDLQEQSY